MTLDARAHARELQRAFATRMRAAGLDHDIVTLQNAITSLSLGERTRRDYYVRGHVKQ